MKYIIAPIATALFLLSGCDNAQTSAPQQPTPEVGVVTLQSQPVPVVSQLTGRTTASLSAEVRPQVGGIIQKRLFTEGDMVKAGQALYQIDPSSYRATWNEAAAALKQAQALVVSDCQKAQRYASLVRDNGVSRQDADDAASTCAQDKASVESKKAALESARINLNWTTVTAPIAGRIGISSVTPGALVSADQDTALATIRGLDTMYVDLTRSSVDLLRLRKQSLASNSDTLSVTLTLEDGSTYPEKGRLALTEVAVDESTGSVTLRAIFPNPQHVLLPGMLVRARIDEGIMNDAILAPQHASAAAAVCDVADHPGIVPVGADAALVRVAVLDVAEVLRYAVDGELNDDHRKRSAGARKTWRARLLVDHVDGDRVAQRRGIEPRA